MHLAQTLTRAGFAALMFAAGSYAQAADPVPAALSAEAFFKPSEIEEIELSPSGRWIAIRETNKEGRIQLKILDLDGKEPTRIIAAFERLNVDAITWVNDEWLIFSTFEEFVNNGKNYSAGLIAVKRDATKMRELIKKTFDDEFAAGGPKPLEPTHSYVALGAPGTNEIIVQENHYDVDYKEIIRTTPRILDIATGRVRTMFKDGLAAPPGNVVDWFIDRQGQTRVAYAMDGPKTLVYWADPATKEWRKIAQFDALQWDYTVRYVDEKDQMFVSVVNPETGMSELRQFDFASGKPAGKALATTPGFDTYVSPVQDRGANQVHGLRLLTKQNSVEWFTPAMQLIQEKVDAMIPGRINVLSCRPCSAPQTVLIFSYSDTSPGDYLLYRPAEGQLERLAPTRTGHRADLMANKEFHRTKSRDGKDLPVWITRLRHGNGARPAIVLVHGGPSSNGEWEYDSDAQFLATRGYVVIEPEFRGSTGYGYDHYRGGWRQWGKAMQDDVADALKFAVDKGWVDPARVCIAGASYGGYSALMGVARQPSPYKCAVAWLAVTDPRMLYSVHWSDLSKNNRSYHLPEMVGDLVKDADMLKANAPIELASQIKAPVLLAYGTKDRRVPVIHGEKMRDAMTRSGNKPEWVEYIDEGHGWRRTVNRVDFWRRVEAFLAQHLK